MIEFVAWLLAVTGSALVLTQSSIMAPSREWLVRVADRAAESNRPIRERVFRLASRLTACPMCSGFWIGIAWSAVFFDVAWINFGARGRHDAAVVIALGFAGSLASAIGVALWLALSEATATMQAWRYLNTPPQRMHANRYMFGMRTGTLPDQIRCPEPGCHAPGGQECSL